jgi:hypothetical protein
MSEKYFLDPLDLAQGKLAVRGIFYELLGGRFTT